MDMPAKCLSFLFVGKIWKRWLGWLRSNIVFNRFSVSDVCTVAQLPSVVQSAQVALQGAIDPAGVASQARELWWGGIVDTDRG